MIAISGLLNGGQVIDPLPPLPEFDVERESRLAAFVGTFQDVFPRADQLQRFRVYLRGLLQPGERKNVEAIASRAAGLTDNDAALAQALQHFVSHSPWDPFQLLGAYRRSVDGMTDPDSAWVVHEAVFPKKGRHSAGVQRQYARTLGRKVNCQIGVILSQIGPKGFIPLAARLYLPAQWLRDHADLVERFVPERYQQPATKAEIALTLIDEVRGEHFGPGNGSLVADDGYATAHELVDGLNARGMKLGESTAPESSVLLAETNQRVEWLRTALGLDHFEGRSWLGWHHHVSLVFVAYGFLVQDRSWSFRRC